MKSSFELISSGYRPWGDQIPAAVGDLGWGRTDTGSKVKVWRPNEGIQEQYRYWCHGHATFSYWLHGFSIFSNDDMHTVLEDEWRRVNKKPEVGDIIVFRALNGKEGEYNQGAILHTARIESAIHQWGARTQIRVSSKNGANKLRRFTEVANVLNVYNDCYWFKTEQSCCCSEKRIDKQYYRRIDRNVATENFVRWQEKNK
ncbi:MAG TPA: hypothetical protein VME63_15775 [Dyella sp.]|uniref:hypothetical protein n=1 Tax=Dyella sp. TaxID=1869338 RepID=UPI002CD10651|nr:hypothetical protein [Dyella sp.]HTV86859.1 hypothetical protein [Dyella sp.]